jgi:two-component system sensor histidine kinase RegB
MRARGAKNERLAAVTTLTAGAAHELSTPLGTIALAAVELERAAFALAQPGLADDARLIRTEVDRCRAILDQMSGRAGGMAAEDLEVFEVTGVIGDITRMLSPAHAARLEIRVPDGAVSVHAPRRGLAQAILTLVRNAFDATVDDSLPVVLDVRQELNVLRVAVHDRGQGLSAEALARAGEPFYTTKEAGSGLGLGLFLARVFAERFGGTLRLESAQGTTAILELPIRPELVMPA